MPLRMAMPSGARDTKKVGSTAAHQISSHMSHRHTSDSTDPAEYPRMTHLPENKHQPMGRPVYIGNLLLSITNKAFPVIREMLVFRLLTLNSPPRRFGLVTVRLVGRFSRNVVYRGKNEGELPERVRLFLKTSGESRAAHLFRD